MTTYAGGPVRKASRVSSGMSVSQVSADARKQLGVNYLTKPFAGTRKNKDVVALVRVFWQMVFDQNKMSKKRRFENLLQAVVRNPLTRGDYGRNKKVTQKIKKSSRKFIDTAQLFKAIKGQVRFGRV